MSDEPNDEFIDIQPWPPAELVGQLVSNVALARRGLIETDSGTEVFERETDRFELDAWARLELPNWLSASDSAILAAPIGSLSPDQRGLCEDAAVVASTIGWAIRAIPGDTLPIPTDGTPEQQALEWAPVPWTPVRNVLKSIRVRSDEELATERERWEIVHWRCSLFHDPESMEDDREALEDTVHEITETGMLTVVNRDLATDDGTALGELGISALQELANQAEIRLQSLNWICGFGERPDSAPLYLDELDDEV